MYKLTHKQYFEALKEGKLLGLKCGECGSITAPPKACCDNCAGIDLEVVGLKGKGEIKTYTITRVAPEGLEAPYVVALVELEEGPWIMGNVEDVDLENVDIALIGKKVTVGHRVITGMNYTAGEGVTPTFQVI
ncbi:MAG TPA: Zn-ribbon domain-containing OB-fold protein [Clostridia bacterium]|nr:Zn-ribbon domain-containing OB-fold protein [Clostridia bacterium]